MANLEKKLRQDAERPGHQDLIHQAEAVTLEIMTKVRARVPNIPIYFLNLCGAISPTERLLCEKADLQCVEGLDEYTQKLEDAGEMLRIAGDLHWNRAGNRVLGQWLVNYFRGQQDFQ